VPLSNKQTNKQTQSSGVIRSLYVLILMPDIYKCLGTSDLYTNIATGKDTALSRPASKYRLVFVTINTGTGRKKPYRHTPNEVQQDEKHIQINFMFIFFVFCLFLFDGINFCFCIQVQYTKETQHIEYKRMPISKESYTNNKPSLNKSILIVESMFSSVDCRSARPQYAVNLCCALHNNDEHLSNSRLCPN